jgi:predicted permease
MSAVVVALAILLSYALIRFFSKPGRADYGVYLYALAFANSGYMGDPLVQSILGGDVALSYYKIFCLPISLAIYTWGISRMIPSDKGKVGMRGILRKIANPPTLSLLLGMIAGLCGLGAYLPKFALDALDKLRGCMGPVAMLLAGFTIGSYGLGRMLSRKKTYVASLLRLIIIPSLIIAVLYGIKTLLCLIPGFQMDNNALYFAFFAIGTPLGLNTVVFPEAYGGDAEVGAGMTLVSHTLCIVTIPLMYALMTILFGAPTIA